MKDKKRKRSPGGGRKKGNRVRRQYKIDIDLANLLAKLPDKSGFVNDAIRAKFEQGNA